MHLLRVFPPSMFVSISLLQNTWLQGLLYFHQGHTGCFWVLYRKAVRYLATCQLVISHRLASGSFKKKKKSEFSLSLVALNAICDWLQFPLLDGYWEKMWVSWAPHQHLLIWKCEVGDSCISRKCQCFCMGGRKKRFHCSSFACSWVMRGSLPSPPFSGVLKGGE